MSSESKRIDDGLEAAPVFEAAGPEVRLLGSECPRCGAVAFPRREVCVRCAGPHRPRELSGAGRLHSWTRLANPPHGFDGELRYGCVDLVEGPRVLAPVADAEPAIGVAVQAVPGAGRHGADGFRFEVRDA
ncbi:MAG: hypothetical protein GXY03_00740 [Solirubrobacterales bacterium]|nr:hypothetical protein [Solirubrobacterales bacterium]